LSRVLIVEDDDAIRMALEVAFEGDGYEVASLDAGHSACEVATALRPDLVVLDVRFPDGPDGFEVARGLRDIAGVAVMFLTAADGPDERQAGLDVGAADYVIKPFSMTDLLSRVRSIVDSAGINARS
jgi:two-component system KDP operon response regulator KdpE